jgi:penicillin-binding protein 1A
MARKQEFKVTKNKRRSLTRRLINMLTTLFVTLGVVWAGLFLVLAPEMPNTADLWRVPDSPGLTVLAADGSVLAQNGAFSSTLIDVAQMPPVLPRAVIATEDRRFYQHFGVDVIGFLRAMAANLSAGRVVQGGSTITQQLAKNLFLTPERTMLRKARELLLALWLEARLSKDDILTLYLNRVYLGAGAYGVEAAAQRYFGKSARNVTLSQAAMLAGLLKAPSRYAPTNDLARSRARAAQVLQNMVAAGYLTARQAAAAKRAPARLAHRARTRGSQYFVDWVQERLPRLVGGRDGDLIVRTTLDPDLQRAAQTALTRILTRHATPRRVAQGAVIALDFNGAVRAMVGGRSYGASQFNRAVQARRQPGSAFKPFVYLAALEAGYSPDSMMRDAPVTVDGWQPRNFSKTFRGDIALRDALALSINTVAVRLYAKIGHEKVVGAARRLGITSPIGPHPSVALGASEVSLIELTSAYVPFANGGQGVITHGIVEVRTRAGKVLFRRDRSDFGQVIKPADAARMTAMLRGAVDRGTGRGARIDGRRVAGKTGTSQNYRDAWFIGYSGNLVAGVWLGNDNDTPTKRVTGGQLPASLWRDFMQTAMASQPAQPPRVPIAARPATPRAVRDDAFDFQRFIDGIAGILAALPGNPATNDTDSGENSD